MDYNKFRTDYKLKHGKTSIDEISKAWSAYKKRKVKPLDLKEISKSLPKTREYKRVELKGEMTRTKEGRGSLTRGWSAMAPQKGRERKELKAKCGSKAFLNPQKEGFPIMGALRATKGKCKIACQGVESARNRACQYGHKNIAQKAVSAGVKHCHWPRNTRACITK